MAQLGGISQRLSARFGPRQSRVVRIGTGTGRRKRTVSLRDQLRQREDLQQAETQARQPFERADELTQEVGQAGLQQIESRRQQDIAQGQQGLISSGLGNTTLQQNVVRGAGADAAQRNLAQNESISRLRAGIQTQLGSSQQSLFQLLLGQLAQRGL